MCMTNSKPILNFYIRYFEVAVYFLQQSVRIIFLLYGFKLKKVVKQNVSVTS